MLNSESQPLLGNNQQHGSKMSTRAKIGLAAGLVIMVVVGAVLLPGAQVGVNEAPIAEAVIAGDVTWCGNVNGCGNPTAYCTVVGDTFTLAPQDGAVIPVVWDGVSTLTLATFGTNTLQLKPGVPRPGIVTFDVTVGAVGLNGGNGGLVSGAAPYLIEISLFYSGNQLGFAGINGGNQYSSSSLLTANGPQTFTVQNAGVTHVFVWNNAIVPGTAPGNWATMSLVPPTTTCAPKTTSTTSTTTTAPVTTTTTTTAAPVTTTTTTTTAAPVTTSSSSTTTTTGAPVTTSSSTTTTTGAPVTTTSSSTTTTTTTTTAAPVTTSSSTTTTTTTTAAPRSSSTTRRPRPRPRPRGGSSSSSA